MLRKKKIHNIRVLSSRYKYKYKCINNEPELENNKSVRLIPTLKSLQQLEGSDGKVETLRELYKQ